MCCVIVDNIIYSGSLLFYFNFFFFFGCFPKKVQDSLSIVLANIMGDEENLVAMVRDEEEVGSCVYFNGC